MFCYFDILCSATGVFVQMAVGFGTGFISAHTSLPSVKRTELKNAALPPSPDAMWILAASISLKASWSIHEADFHSLLCRLPEEKARLIVLTVQVIKRGVAMESGLLQVEESFCKSHYLTKLLYLNFHICCSYCWQWAMWIN